MLSIITPVLNGGKFIKENIESILQLPIPFQHIIVDGGSTDNTLDIISNYRHIKLLNQTEKTGMYGAIHQGILESQGEYISYVNADDKVISQGFMKMYSKISHADIDLIYSDAYFCFPNSPELKKIYGKIFGKYFLKKGILPFVQPSSIFTRSVYSEVGGFRYKDFRICGDLDLFQRIALKEKSRVYYLPIESSIFYKYDQSLGSTNEELYFQEKRMLTVNKGEYFIYKALASFSTALARVKKIQA